MVFYNNINPVLLKLGAFEIRYYGIIYALSFVIAYFMIYHLAKQRKLKLSKDDVADFLIYLIIGTIFGARVFHIVFYDLGYYIKNPLEMLMVWKGGLSFHGGLVGSVIAGSLFCRKKKINFYKIADITVIPLALGLALGRIANFTNHELYGKITNVPWAVKFKNVDGFRHPTQIYESLKNFFIFGVLWFLKNKKLKDGFLFLSFIVMYSFIRFFLEFLKDPQEAGSVGYLTMGQILTIPMFFIGVYFLIKLRGGKNEKR